MCGILFCCRPHLNTTLSASDTQLKHLLSSLRVACSLRGPDAQNEIHVKLENGERVGAGLDLEFYASELRLRGDQPIMQPHVSPERDVLCWNGEIFEGISVGRHENDGVKLFSLLREARSVQDVVGILGNIEGPYALVYYRASSKMFYFCRDPLGRRSLLVHYPTEEKPYFLLASVSVGNDSRYALEELPATHIYVLDLMRLSQATPLSPQFTSCLHELAREADPPVYTPWGAPARVNRELPPDNVPLVQDLDHVPDYLLKAVNGLISQLSRSVKLQVLNIPRLSSQSGQGQVAILFSGGIDSTALAYFAHQHVPHGEPIDLLNVAFENPRKLQHGQASYLVPDRLTGITETEELRRVCPGRTWNFVEIDVSHHESQGARLTVGALMYPCQTVMDMSLAIALYYAARGKGHVLSSPNATPVSYESRARVLLNGLGADELLAGYGRHRTTFKHGSWPALIDELQLEIDRISSRNLGRDDRVISCHGKEARHPFLSLSVVNFIVGLPVHMKTDPRAEQGIGDKLLLRLAMRQVGMVEASSRKKKAMQFGSHSARMEGGGPKKGDIVLV